MVHVQSTPYTKDEILASLDPTVQDWFTSKFHDFSPPQTYSIVNIKRRISTLISSPTGSGKTLSAFLTIMSELIALSKEGLLEERTYCVYVSPLKALTRDIERNLKEPLVELERLWGASFGIRIGVRTGDTTPHERARMLKTPPHIFITTPESLAIVLSTKKFSEYLQAVEWIIVDEIHALAENKRGVHLSLSLERFELLSHPCRIGLSATVAPLEIVAQFLVGYLFDQPRACALVDVSNFKNMEVDLISPVKNLMTTEYGLTHQALYSIIDQLIQDHRTTLIFTNTRSGTERVLHYLKENYPKHYQGMETDAGGGMDDEGAEQKDKKHSGLGRIGAHHSSLSKEHRVEIETRLRNGDLKAVVSSTSLELGIDIGYIDLVVLLGSPKSIARAMQRIGRSGHKLHDSSKGKMIVLDRDDLVECAVLLKGMHEQKIDTIRIPRRCLDVLAQQILGIVVGAKEPLEVSEVYQLVKRAYPYHDLSYADFLQVITYLAGHHSDLEERNVYGKIWYDTTTNTIGKKGKFARVLFMTNVGTIPDETSVKVRTLGRGHEGMRLGTLSEAFLEKLKRGDVFVLGGETFIFLYAQGLTAFVKPCTGKTPTVPSWFSETLPLSYELALSIGKFRRFLHEHFESKASQDDIVRFIQSYLYINESTAQQIYHYTREQYLYAKIPHDKRIVIEHFSDVNKRYYIFHTLYGRRVNDVLSRAVAFVAGKISQEDMEIGINDNGFYLASKKPLQVRRALQMITVRDLSRILDITLEKTEVLARHFRHCAARGLMILRQYKGARKSVGRQQMSSRVLIAAVKKISPDFPILKEAKREVLEDLMDIQHAGDVIDQIQKQEVRVDEIFTDIASPFAFNLITQGYSDVLRMEDKFAFLKRMHEMVLQKIDLKEQRKGDSISECD